MIVIHKINDSLSKYDPEKDDPTSFIKYIHSREAKEAFNRGVNAALKIHRPKYDDIHSIALHLAGIDKSLAELVKILKK